MYFSRPPVNDAHGVKSTALVDSALEVGDMWAWTRQEARHDAIGHEPSPLAQDFPPVQADLSETGISQRRETVPAANMPPATTVERTDTLRPENQLLDPVEPHTADFLAQSRDVFNRLEREAEVRKDA